MGNVGGTLGRRWAAGGHRVTFGSRHPDDPKDRAEAAQAKASVASIRDACAGAEVVVLATPWPAVRDALAAAGDLAGKVLLDCTNPLTADLSGLEVGHGTSGGEEVARLA